MKNLRKSFILGIFILFVGIVMIPQEGNASFISQQDKVENLKTFPENSMERYAYSKSIENNTLFEDELEKEKNIIIPLAYDEYITYRTKSGNAGSIRTNKGTLTPVINTEAKVVVSRVTNRVTRVIDFGAPYASVKSYYANWSGGGFNINRINDTSARFSSTGQFIIDSGSFSVGLDIISVSQNLGSKTKVMTINTTLGW